MHHVVFPEPLGPSTTTITSESCAALLILDANICTISGVKLCSGCGEVKPLSEFHKNKGRKNGVNSRCKPCRAVIDHRRYEVQVGRSVPRYPQRSELGRSAWLASLKSGRPCTDCRRVFAYQVMQWDHRPGTHKLGDISADFWGRSREEVLAEIAKCDLVCANCHAIRTFSRSGWATWWVRDGNALYVALQAPAKAA
jgi:hypothetical protein